MLPGQVEPPALSELAGRLTDIAGSVARDAEAAAGAIRALTDQAQQIAAMAVTLGDAAEQLERETRQHHAELATARTALDSHRPAVASLERSPERLATISASIVQIARQSRMLSINARIEAARSGPEARGFAAVAAEMSELSNRTHDATRAIGASADVLAEDAQGARAMVASQDGLVTNQAVILAAALDQAERQRDTAAVMVELASDGAERISAAASSISRVGASATAVKMLAREIAKRA